MHLIINSGDDIIEFQKAFEVMFPFLRIEFVAWKSDDNENDLLSYTFLNVRLANEPEESQVDICYQSRFSDVAYKFREYYQLESNLFRKVGNIWLQALNTRDWTLREQNDFSHYLSDLFKESNTTNSKMLL